MSLGHGPSIIRDSSLVLYVDAANSKSYPGSGTTWTDLSGSNYNGTVTAGTVYSSSNLGFFTFDGTSQKVAIGDVLSRTTAGESITLSAWVYPTRNSGYIMGRSTANANYGHYSLILSSGSVKLVIYGTSVGYNHYTLGSISNNVWSHVAISHVFGTGASTISAINGVSGGSWTTGTGTSVSDQGSNSLEIGHWYGTPTATSNDYWFQGNIASAQIYNRGLTLLEIQQNFNALRGRYDI